MWSSWSVSWSLRMSVWKHHSAAQGCWLSRFQAIYLWSGAKPISVHKKLIPISFAMPHICLMFFIQINGLLVGTFYGNWVFRAFTSASLGGTSHYSRSYSSLVLPCDWTFESKIYFEQNVWLSQKISFIFPLKCLTF